MSEEGFQRRLFLRIGIGCLCALLSLPCRASDAARQDYNLTISILASSSDGVSSQCGTRLIARVGPQIVLLAACHEVQPLALGDYKARTIKYQVTRRGNIDQRYALPLPDRSEMTVYVAGQCAQGTSTCFGYSISQI